MAVPLALKNRVGAASIGREVDLPCHDLTDLTTLGGMGITVTFNPGQTMVIEGDPIEYCFRIITGTVRLYKAIPDGRRQVIDFLGQGQCFGLTGFERYTYSAEALSPVTLIRHARQTIEAAIDTKPGVAQALFRLACTELDQAQRQMLLLGRKSADEKIASFLLGLRERSGNGREARDVVHLPMSRQDMADYLGLTIETVSRTISRFRRLGLIGLIGRQHVTLCQVERLRELADGLMPDGLTVDGSSADASEGTAWHGADARQA